MCVYHQLLFVLCRRVDFSHYIHLMVRWRRRQRRCRRRCWWCCCCSRLFPQFFSTALLRDMFVAIGEWVLYIWQVVVINHFGIIVVLSIAWNMLICNNNADEDREIENRAICDFEQARIQFYSIELYIVSDMAILIQFLLTSPPNIVQRFETFEQRDRHYSQLNSRNLHITCVGGAGLC